MKIMGIDPSSTCTGYALLDGKSFDLLYAGRLTCRAQDYVERTASMITDLTELLNEHKPHHIVIEIPDRNPHRHKRQAMQGAGLGVYGFAVGAMWWHIVRWAEWTDVEIWDVGASDWTRGKKKMSRRENAAMMYPQYREIMDKDPGGDISDAICLALWKLQNLLEMKHVEKEGKRRRVASRGNGRGAKPQADAAPTGT